MCVLYFSFVAFDVYWKWADNLIHVQVSLYIIKQ